MCHFVLVLALSLIHHWSAQSAEAVPSTGSITRNNYPGNVPVVLKGDGMNAGGRQVYLLCWKGVCDPRLWAEMAKRTPYYNFGLGKRSTTFRTPSEVEMSRDEEATGEPMDLENDKRGSAYRYNFGVGKKDEQRQRFNFGLGKRYDDLKHKFAFGLGKRDAEEPEGDGAVEDYQYDTDNVKRQYNFGLGKRSSPYNFGLGKRRMYNFGIGKRNRLVYGFGLGKRDVEPVDGAEEYEDDSQMEDDERDEKRSGPYSFGLGKRSVDWKRNRYAFGLGKREATTTSPLSDDEGNSPNLGNKSNSRTTSAPTKESNH